MAGACHVVELPRDELALAMMHAGRGSRSEIDASRVCARRVVGQSYRAQTVASIAVILPFDMSAILSATAWARSSAPSGSATSGATSP